MSDPDPDPVSAVPRQLIWPQLKAHEGLRLHPYRDTAGKLTIGVGRNLDDVGLREGEAMFLCFCDIAAVEQALDARLPWWRTLDDARRAVLVDMGFNMGVAALCGFTDTLAAARAGRYGDASQSMLRSRWAGQVGRRAATLSRMMRTGESFATVAGGGAGGSPSRTPPDPGRSGT